MSEKKLIELQKIHADLFSTDDSLVEKALGNIVKKGNELSVIPLLEFYVSIENTKFKNIAEKMLLSLKVPNASVYLVEALSEPHFEDHKPFILSIFWNAAIPPHSHLLELTEEAVHGDFLCAFEVLTIFENIDGDIDPLILEGSLSEVNGYLEFREDGPKTALIESIQEILEGLSVEAE